MDLLFLQSGPLSLFNNTRLVETAGNQPKTGLPLRLPLFYNQNFGH
jgi:hypothetical protein